MRLIVSSIVGGVYEQNSTVKKICADDWTAERTIIASNVLLIISAPAGGVSLHETCCHGYTLFCISAPAGASWDTEVTVELWESLYNKPINNEQNIISNQDNSIPHCFSLRHSIAIQTIEILY